MPMNQGPIAYLKRKYRTNLLRNSVLDANFLKEYNVKMAIYSLANLWQELPEDLLRSSWHKLKTNLNIEYNFEAIDMHEIRSNFNKLGLNLPDHEINCWLDTDYGDAGYGFLTDQEIIEQIKQPVLTNVTLNDVSLNDSVKIISSKVAFSYCNQLMTWLEQQTTTKPDDLTSMQRIKELTTGMNDSVLSIQNDDKQQESLNESISSSSSKLTTTFLDEEIPTSRAKLNEGINEAVAKFLDEEMPRNRPAGKINESNSEVDSSFTTFLDEEPSPLIIPKVENIQESSVAVASK